MLLLQRLAFAEEGRRVGRLPDGQEIPPLAEPLDAIEQHVREQTALVARLDGRVIGAVRGVVTSRVCVIRALAVAGDCRGRGIGSALLMRCMEEVPVAVEAWPIDDNIAVQCMTVPSPSRGRSSVEGGSGRSQEHEPPFLRLRARPVHLLGPAW